MYVILSYRIRESNPRKLLSRIIRCRETDECFSRERDSERKILNCVSRDRRYNTVRLFFEKSKTRLCSESQRNVVSRKTSPC